MAIRTRSMEKLQEALEEIINETTPEVNAGDVTGLDEAIDERISEMDKPEADDIRGLDDAISDSVDGALREINWSDKLGTTIAEKVDESVKDLLPDAIKTALRDREPVDVKAAVLESLRSPEAQAVLQNEIRRALLGVFQAMLVTVVQVANPVQ